MVSVKFNDLSIKLETQPQGNVIVDISFEMDETTLLGLIVLLEHLATSTSTMDDMMCVLMDIIVIMTHIHDNLVMKHAPNVLAHQKLNALNEIAHCYINLTVTMNDH